MMLQGHFISALLQNELKDRSDVVYNIWEYFRGITAPIFFTVTGFIFMFLILRKPDVNYQKQRINKGIKRGITLILWGYFLRFGIGGLFIGHFHESYFYSDVLHIIGVSLIILCILYNLLYTKYKTIFSYTLVAVTFFSFLFERYYNHCELSILPKFIAHYFTGKYGAVFSLFPWFGYVSIGAFLSILFIKHQNTPNFNKKLIYYTTSIGLILLFLSSPILLGIGGLTKIKIFTISGDYNYLFSRLGDVFLIFSIFVFFRNKLNNNTFISLGKVTLSIYIVHHIILYGSWFNTGLVRWFYNSLNYYEAFLGALIFMFIVSFLVLKFRDTINQLFNFCYKLLIKGVNLINLNR